MTAAKKPSSKAKSPGRKTADAPKAPPKSHAAGKKRRGKTATGRVSAGRSEPAPKCADAQTDSRGESHVTVVGVGASAGGLEAFTEFLAHLPCDVGMAVVLVQHMDPQHKSNLVEILSRSTPIPVEEAADGMPLKPDHIYVIPADKDIAVFHGAISLIPRPSERTPHLPIDGFLRSLAEDQGDRAIGVILSGMGSDGALGMRAIKAAGGITLVQDEKTAKCSSMPHSAVAVGRPDFVLPPGEIARELARIGQHPFIERARGRLPKEALEAAPDSLQKVFLTLRSATGVDFTHYKKNTVHRRISRRMVLHRIDNIEHYVRYLQETPGEVGALFEDMLISVTGFFREPKMFEVLKKKVLPAITEGRNSDVPIRVWVPGCSTGEEAYSIAICLLEYCDGQQIGWPIQIFATDVSDTAIETARAGCYPQNIAVDVSEQRLHRFFAKFGSGYQISKAIRDACLFARQNVIKDPPFSKLDLISCRNLLIYLDMPIQKQVIPVFHYALNPKGFLVLGSSETIGAFSDLFSPADRKFKIYSKKVAASRLPAGFRGLSPRLAVEIPNARRAPAGPRPDDVGKVSDQIILARYGLSGVVVNGDLEVVQFRGQTGRYIDPAPGTATFRVLKMVRADLLPDLRAAIAEARKNDAPSRKESVSLARDGQSLAVSIEVIPIKAAATGGHLLILFKETPAEAPAGKPAARSAPGRGRGKGRAGAEKAEEEVRQLREQLAVTRASLQTIIEEHEATDEEIRAANEEIQSGNEELQSTNEELETAKEELQATNEELSTLNDELETRNRELQRTADDLGNLLNSVEIPVVMLGADRCIRSATPAAQSVLNIRTTDIGRPIGELRLALDLPGLEETISDVIQNLRAKEQEVCSRDSDRRYSMRVRPYRTADNRIDGVVIALIDITDHIAMVRAEVARQYAESIVDAIREPLVVLDGNLRVVSASRSFYRNFQATPEETRGRPLYELGNRQWDIPALRQLLETVLPEHAAFDHFRVERDFPGIGRRVMVLNARQIEATEGSPTMILLAFEDITHGEGKA
jgi:two-component system CheB/CheR fusion protein